VEEKIGWEKKSGRRKERESEKIGWEKRSGGRKDRVGENLRLPNYKKLYETLYNVRNDDI